MICSRFVQNTTMSGATSTPVGPPLQGAVVTPVGPAIPPLGRGPDKSPNSTSVGRESSPGEILCHYMDIRVDWEASMPSVKHLGLTAASVTGGNPQRQFMTIWKRFMKAKGLDYSVRARFPIPGPPSTMCFGSHVPAPFKLRVCPGCTTAARAGYSPRSPPPTPAPPPQQPAIFNRGVMDVYKLFRLVVIHGGFQKARCGWVQRVLLPAPAPRVQEGCLCCGREVVQFKGLMHVSGRGSSHHEAC